MQEFRMLDNNSILLACSGASNVGQLSNQAVIELTKEGFGKFFCLAGIGAHLNSFVQSAKSNPEAIVIDGCPVGCARRVVEHAEIPIGKYLVVTKLGIGKNYILEVKKEDVEKVKRAVKNLQKEE